MTVNTSTPMIISYHDRSRSNIQFVSLMNRWFLVTIISVTLISWYPAAVGFSTPSIPCRVADKMCTPIRQQLQLQENEPSMLRWGTPPYIAVLTEPDACMSLIRVEETIHSIEQAVMCGGVNLVVLRVDDSSDESDGHKWVLLQRLAELRIKYHFLLIVNNDVDIVLRALSDNIFLDGVHVKEHNAHMIPSIRSELYKYNENIVIGTSCHTLQSAMESYNLGPDYLFVGTCYLTQSHPEKQSVDQLEGPSFPGRVKQELYRMYNKMSGTMKDSELIHKPTIPPMIFAIGGINEQNCHEPVVTYGADGVAVIRTVMQASDPGEVVLQMKAAMEDNLGSSRGG